MNVHRKPPSLEQAQLVLPADIYNAIIGQAQAEQPREVCGLLRGKAGSVHEIKPAMNIAANPYLDYEVDPASLLEQFNWEEAGDELIAIYHSHPASPAYPSASDAYRAFYPDAVYVICSLLDPLRPDLRGYYLKPVAGQQLDLDQLASETEVHETRPGRWGVHVPAYGERPDSVKELDYPQAFGLYVVWESLEGNRADIRIVAVQPVHLQVSEPISEG